MTQPTDPAKRHSAGLTLGPERAFARSYLKSIGYTDADMGRPIVGVAHEWIETMPCNYNHRELARYVKDGIRAAGGMPVEVNTIAISDG
ncbi:MAG: dihydroxy-acid dehydratase, partial [Actinobacteria bacterium]|nr:dihydroxy-acid dehydratase [Actinomycetota bacterium]